MSMTFQAKKDLMRIYSVGGSVRDELLGLQPHDFDWVIVGATPEDIARLLAEKYTPAGKDFPVFLHPDTHEEYALARKERKVGPGHTGFETTFSPDTTLEEDLLRRDLTINAMAKDPQTGAIIDPYHGREDLKNGILRHVSEAFSEDPLRVLRLARFLAKTGFTVHPSTLTLCEQISKSGALKELSFERIFAEFFKLLELPNAVLGMQTLKDIGALDALNPQWNSRLTPAFLQVFDQVCQREDFPLHVKSSFLLGILPAQEAKTLLSSLKFPTDTQRFSARLMNAFESLNTPLIPHSPQGAVDSSASDSSPSSEMDALASQCIQLIECGNLLKASDEEARLFFEPLLALSSLSHDPAAFEYVIAKTQHVLPHYQQTDLKEALSLPEGQKKDGQLIAKRVSQARLESVKSALSPKKPLIFKGF